MRQEMFLKKFNFWKNQIFLCCFLLFSINLSAQNISKYQVLPDSSEIAETEKTAEELSKQLNAESIRRSIELFLTVSRQWETIGNFEKSADCLREISNLNIPLGNAEKAILHLDQARRLDGKYNNSNKNVKTLSLLALANLRLGKIDSAREFAENAVKLSQKTNNFDSLATALYTQALINYDDGKFNLATENFAQSLIWWQKDGNSHAQVKALLELAYAYMTNDELLIGLEKAEECFKIANEIGDLQYKIYARNAIAVLKSKLGKKQEALNIFLQSEIDFPDDVNLLEKGDMYNHLAGIYYDFDELKLALKYRLKALEIFRKMHNLYAQLAVLSKIGIITFKLDDENKGLEYFDEGFKIARQVKSDYFYSVFAQDLGNLYFENNKAEALKYYNLALPNFEKLKIRTHIAIIQSKIGSIYQSQGKPDLAREYFNSALKFNRETKNQFAESQNLYNLANLAASENKPDTALELAKQSIEVTEHLSSEVLNSKLKSTYFSNVFDRYELYINLLMKMHQTSSNATYVVEALRATEKSRARLMLEKLSLSEANFTKDADTETVRREKEIRVLLNSKADKLTDLLSKKVEKSETDKISNEINELDNELETLKAKLKQQSPIYSAIKNPAPFDVGEFQRNVLDENSLLLEFSLGNDESYLWLIGKNEISSYVLPPREEIESKIEKLRGLLKANELKSDESVEDFQKRIREAEIEYQSVAKDLSNQLFGQIADKLARNRLIIVPDGELHYFPIAALPLPNSATDEPILLTNETIYEPSAQTLTIFAKSQKQAAPTAKNLLVFSDPIFTSDDARFSPENKPLENSNTETVQTDRFRFVESLKNLPRLAASKDESETIINIVGAARADNFSGFAATREKLLNLKTADYKIIHFATHGLTDEKRPELSGIVLSRFDEKGQKLNEFFRIQDIYGLNLNADLVVLSACETGIGKAVKGEGLMSLNNAFLQTGAKTVMSSLWKVEDSATLELMKNFYGAMKDKNLTPSESLRQAQIKLREKPQYKSPFYWAAFTVQGDFRNVPKISNDSGFWVYLLPIVPLALIGIYLYRRKNYSTAKP